MSRWANVWKQCVPKFRDDDWESSYHPRGKRESEGQIDKIERRINEGNNCGN